MDTLTSAEVCAKAGISRHVLNYWTGKLGIAQVSRTIDENNSILLRWPGNTAARLRRAYQKRQKRRARGKR